MKVNGTSATSIGYSSSGRQTALNYLKQVNDKFTKANIKKGSFLPSSANSSSKPAVIVSQAFLELAAGKPELADQFEKKIPKIVEVNQLFGTINYTGRELGVKGYTVDRSGKLVCHGIDYATDKEFEINLGSVRDKSTNYKNIVYEHFDLSPAAILLATYKK